MSAMKKLLFPFAAFAACGDVEAAAEALDLLLKHRMFPFRRWA
ncbi:hypothetical protein [Actinomadura sp. 9N215]